jgi:hypothetical protein
MLRRIKYISSFATPLSEADIQGIVEVCQRNNPAKKITGVLMASGGLFFQILEGPEQEVGEVYQTILEDPRHRKVTMLADQRAVEDRLFPDWSMKRLDLSDSAKQRAEPLQSILDTIISLNEDIERLSLALTLGIWQEFVKGQTD